MVERSVSTPSFIMRSEHTFDTVDHKIAEAEFFLQRLFGSGIFEFGCYFSAYLSASRTVTLALQRFFHIPGFESWYGEQRVAMKNDELAKLFLALRNDHVHGGMYPVSGSVSSNGRSVHFFRGSSGAVVEDIATAAREHFVRLLEIVYSAYVEFGESIDPQQYLTKEHFSSLGMGIDEAEVEVYGWVCEHLVEEGYDEDDRWDELRGNADECHINYLFYSYLGKPTPQPIVPEHFEDFAYTPEDRGWTHTPAGYADREVYLPGEPLCLMYASENFLTHRSW